MYGSYVTTAINKYWLVYTCIQIYLLETIDIFNRCEFECKKMEIRTVQQDKYAFICYII